MSMPTWAYPLSWAYAGWTLAAFIGTVIWCSFAEFMLHRFVMHRKTFVSFPYELHAVGHHGMFRGDETYHAQNEDMRNHVTFVARDYVILLAANLPLWCSVEWLVGRPLVIGGFLATFAYLQAFNSFHWRWHVPSDTWLQRTSLFKWAKERHRIHHDNQGVNFNLVLPLADLLFRTYRSGPAR